ncbi:MAG: DUF2971 domain-containing protein [Gammaproteobacteria bacterium AqS3]|nr:DUF2971 domain-containing protein [Gammaproteobacteria bacterium AqS3]
MNTASEPESKKFYKYMSASTAKIVLVSNKLRWKSPLCFNDPFDIVREIAHNISRENIHTAFKKMIKEIISNDRCIDISDFTPAIQDFIKQEKISRDNNKKEWPVKFNKTNFYQIINQDLLIDFDNMKNVWRNDSLYRMRVLCLSAEKHILPMWYHYADKYSGAVLEINLSNNIDSPWLDFRPINYSDSATELSSAKIWAELSMFSTDKMIKKLNDIHDLFAYRKKKDWSYEQEWRAVRYAPEDNEHHYSDIPIDTKYFSKIYLGPKMKQKDYEDIKLLISKSSKLIGAYRMSFGLDQKIKFTKILDD